MSLRAVIILLFLRQGNNLSIQRFFDSVWITLLYDFLIPERFSLSLPMHSSQNLQSLFLGAAHNYDIYLKNIKIYENLPTTTLLNQTIGKTTITILNGILSSITIYDNSSIVYSENVKLLDKANVNVINGNIILKAYTTTNEYYLLILNSDYELIYNGYFDNLDENNNLFTGFTNLYDIAKHGHVCEINLDDLSNINDYYVVKDGGKRCNCQELIPQAFLEALKVKNFSLAKSYLNSTLANASNSHFEAFFGPIQAIYYNCYNNSSPINYTVYNGEYKFYNFTVKNQKIVDIEEC